MSRKVLFAMVAMVEAFLLLIAYSANEPFRQSEAKDHQLELAEERGAHTYVQYCMACHGANGQGYLENVGLQGKPLNRSDLQSTDADTLKANVRLITQTVDNGRAGTVMPAWGVDNGGPLNYQMVNELVALITNGRWDLVTQTIRDQGVAIPTEPAITDPVATGMQIVTQGPCASCHTVSGTSANGKVGPALDGIASRQIAGVLPFSTENVKRWVPNPPGVKPGTAMPPYQLKDAYLDAIAAYLATLR
jgi:mono/diheme cytochrome c family protein